MSYKISIRIVVFQTDDTYFSNHEEVNLHQYLWNITDTVHPNLLVQEVDVLKKAEHDAQILKYFLYV